MVDWVCGSLIPQLHLTTLLRRLRLQTNLYCADSGSKQISTVQTRAPNDVIYSRWQQPYRDAFASLFYSGRKQRRVVHLFYSLWFKYTQMLENQRICGTWRIFWRTAGSFTVQDKQETHEQLSLNKKITTVDHSGNNTVLRIKRM